MSKESTPLEVLKKIGKLKVEGIKVIPEKATVSDYVYYSIIETALKRLEELEKELGVALNLHECQIIKEWIVIMQSKLKALEITEGKPLTFHLIFKYADYDEYLFVVSRIVDEYQFGYVYSKEEFDLLKKVLNNEKI